MEKLIGRIGMNCCHHLSNAVSWSGKCYYVSVFWHIWFLSINFISLKDNILKMHEHMFLTMYSVSPPIERILFAGRATNKSWKGAWWSMKLTFSNLKRSHLWCLVCVSYQRRERTGGNNQLEGICCLEIRMEKERALCFIQEESVVERGHELFSLNDDHLIKSCKF